MRTLMVVLGLALLAARPAPAETLVGLQLAAGDRLVWRSGSEEFTEEVESVTDGVASIRSSRDGQYAQPLEFVLPPPSWAGGPDGTGTSRIMRTKGELFPLAPSKRLTVTYRGTSDQEPAGWIAVRACTVAARSEVEVPAGHFSVLPVSCQERSRSRTWYFAPELGLVVRYENIHRIAGGTTQDLVAVQHKGQP